MATRQLAQGLADLGRNGDSVLVHMQPREVAGLQALAMSQGGSLTINPDTGLPEANFLGDVLGAVAPVAVGGLLSMVPGMTPLTAGLLTGAATWALTGDPLKGVMGGFGASGGFGLGKDLAKFGGIRTIPTTQIVGEVADDALLQSTPYATARGVADVADDAILGAQKSFLESQTQIPTFAQSFEGVKKGTERALSSPIEFLKQSDNPFGNVATLASPLLTAGSTAPTYAPNIAYPQFDYKGPYKPQERGINMPTEEEQQQIAAAGSPEWTYFNQSNPVPGYTYAAGGSITSGGIRDLYGQPDDQANGAVLSQDGYGLGRLQQMYGGGVAGYAGGGPISFDAGGTIPTVGSIPEMSKAAQASYAAAPTDLSEVAAIGASAPGVSGLSALNEQASQATNDPMGRIGRVKMPPMALAAMGMNPREDMRFGQLPPMARASFGPMYGFMRKDPEALLAMNPRFANSPLFKRMFPNYGVQATPEAPTMQNYIQAAQRTQTQPGVSPAGVEQQMFDRINPQPVQAAQGGIMSLAQGGKPTSGGYLDGPGDGMSDSIPATIAGKQPACLADGEFVVPADVVSHLGNGSTKAGAKHLYKMMDKVRQARTGTKKQGREINPSKYLKV